ncbi:hypothetical protein AGMMS49587_20630 [Spirochaetia bacterium]|nr:hypothetical protein AGMMS49587_20630 [Spirochaetia bacterium]
MMFDAAGAIVPMIGQGVHFVEHTPDGEDPFHTLDVSLGDGLQFGRDDDEITLRVEEGSGLRFVGNKGEASLQVYAGQGLAIQSKGPLNVIADGNKGIAVNNEGIFAKLGAGLAFDQQGLITVTGGGEDYTNGDGIAIPDDNEISVNVNAFTGLNFDNNHRLAIVVDVDSGLTRHDIPDPNNGGGTMSALAVKLGNRLHFEENGAIGVTGAADYEGAGCIDVNEETRQIALRYRAGSSLYLDRTIESIPSLAIELFPDSGHDNLS